MRRAAEVKARAQELRARKAALEAVLVQTPNDTRAVRMELAQIEEELVDCARELRDLMPRHKVSYKTTWAGTEGRRWDQMQYQTWAELEGVEEQDGPTERDLMRQAMHEARKRLTDKQEEYLSASETGANATQIALDKGVDKSTVIRTLNRARSKMEREAKALYRVWAELKNTGEQGGSIRNYPSTISHAPKRAGRKLERSTQAICTLLEKRTSAGVMVIDLADPDTLRAVLDLLTNKQQVYLYLYYGEWLSLREIGDLFGVDHSVVLRSIRAALERLDRLLAGQEVKVRGLDALEERLIAHFNRAELEAEPPRKPPRPSAPRSRAGSAPERQKACPSMELPAPLDWTLTMIRGRELRTFLAERYKPTITCHWGSGRLLPLLKKALAPTVPWEDTKDYASIRHRVYRAVRRCLSKLFCMIRRDLDADNH